MNNGLPKNTTISNEIIAYADNKSVTTVRTRDEKREKDIVRRIVTGGRYAI